MNSVNRIKKTFRIVHQLILAILLVFSLIAASFAWFTFYRQSDVPAFFGGGVAEELLLEIGVVEVEGLEIDRIFSFLNKPESEKKVIGFEELEKDGDTYQIKMSDINFGVIDNVTILKPENIVYLRLTIPARLGNNIRFSLNNDDEGLYHHRIYLNIYNQNGDITGQQDIYNGNSDAQNIIDALNLVEEDHGSFINYEYALTEINNGNSLGGSGINFNSGVFNLKENNIIEGEYDGQYKNIDGEDFYYLYIKLTPNLTSISYAAQYLTKYMPCYMTFSIDGMFEVIQ